MNELQYLENISNSLSNIEQILMLITVFLVLYFVYKFLSSLFRGV